MTKTKLAFLKALSAVIGNLSAAFFALAIATPNFTNLATTEALFVLTKDIGIGILLLVVTTIIERYLK